MWLLSNTSVGGPMVVPSDGGTLLVALVGRVLGVVVEEGVPAAIEKLVVSETGWPSLLTTR